MEDMFLVCAKCGKKLIQRLPNGLFYFVFGKKKDKEGKMFPFSPVEIYLHGSIKIRCLSRECGHFNVFNYFPSEDKKQLKVDQPKEIGNQL